MTHMVDLSESAGMRKTNCKSLSDADIAFVRSGLARGKTVHAISAEMHRDHRTIKLRLREDGIEWRTRAPARAVAPPPSGRTKDALPPVTRCRGT